MFFIKRINLSNFNTNNVTNMRDMFYGCHSLKELNLSNFNTNRVNFMGFMFDGCFLLEELNLSDFNTNNVIDMEYMFCECSQKIQNKIRAKFKKIKEEDIN